MLSDDVGKQLKNPLIYRVGKKGLTASNDKATVVVMGKRPIGQRRTPMCWHPVVVIGKQEFGQRLSHPVVVIGKQEIGQQRMLMCRLKGRPPWWSCKQAIGTRLNVETYLYDKSDIF